MVYGLWFMVYGVWFVVYGYGYCLLFMVMVHDDGLWRFMVYETPDFFYFLCYWTPLPAMHRNPPHIHHKNTEGGYGTLKRRDYLGVYNPVQSDHATVQFVG
jgi:hypothetical protein